MSDIFWKDKSWNCSECSSFWCEHIAEHIKLGKDSLAYRPEMTLVVPIFPNSEVFVEVRIGEEETRGVTSMALLYTPDIGTPYTVDLGYWHYGEGMYSIRSVIVDYFMSKLSVNDTLRDFPNQFHTACPSSIHGLHSSRVMRENTDLNWKTRCLWNIVMEKACTACLLESEMSSGNFGIDESIIPGRR